jgi:hypothetical protein
MTPLCACGCGRERGSWRSGARRGYRTCCYRRWADAGFPAGGPPAPRHAPGGWGTRAGRLEDYVFLTREQRLPVAEALARMGLSSRTVQRYENALREAS